jgi:protein TonB
MPRDLFGDVTDPSITLGSRKWSTMPVSLGVHSVIVALLIVAPLMAAGTLPRLHDVAVYMPVEPPELPKPPDVPRPKAPDQPVTNPAVAPLTEPTAIAEELPFEPGFENDSPAESIIDTGAVEGASVVAPPPVVAAPASQREPVRPGGVIRTPERISYVAPAYPAIALAARVQGMVIIEATIDTAGRVVNARVLRTDSPLFTEAALSAVRQWTYTPTQLNGVPVSVIMTVTVHFRMN